MISQHYLLTSAHGYLLSGASPTTVFTGDRFSGKAYEGDVDVVLHPNWVDAAPDGEE